jgi:hypothetical protein
MFEDAQDMFMLYNISPELTCQCDEFHICQQCCEEDNEMPMEVGITDFDTGLL